MPESELPSCVFGVKSVLSFDGFIPKREGSRARKKENPAGLPASLSASASLTVSVSLRVSLCLSLPPSLSLSPQDSRDALYGAGRIADFYTTTRDLGTKSNLFFVTFHLISHFTSCKNARVTQSFPTDAIDSRGGDAGGDGRKYEAIIKLGYHFCAMM